MRCFGKRYTWKLDGDKVRFFIDGKDGSERRTDKYFKYYALDHNSVDALTHQYLYATHPCQLNDPLDCAEDIIKFDDIETARIFLDIFVSKVSEMYENDETSINEFAHVAFRTFYYMKSGIFSLTKKDNDISLWSYYTFHKGFCVEFDINTFPFDYWGPFPINYQKELKQVSLKKASLPIASLIQTNIKLDCWKNEQEWRLLIQCPDDYYLEPFGFKTELIKSNIPDIHERKFNYPMCCIKSICLGLKFFNDERFIISGSEGEYVSDDKLQNVVLAFLAKSGIPTYVMENYGLSLSRCPIEIIQLGDTKYSIKYL